MLKGFLARPSFEERDSKMTCKIELLTRGGFENKKWEKCPKWSGLIQ
jgi:hypothetical protein